MSNIDKNDVIEMIMVFDKALAITKNSRICVSHILMMGIIILIMNA